MRKIKEIIVHCTATKPNMDWHVSDVDKCHRNRGFKCIGYHYVICLDGSIEAGRNESEQGAHCYGHNRNSIGIAYVGGLDENGKPSNTINKEQMVSLLRLISRLCKKYGYSDTSCVHVHNEFANKACPCFTRDWLEDYLKLIVL